MAGRCWNCKKFEEHFYWEHLEETRYRFLKVMEGDFCHVMEFPKKFSRNFRVELSDSIILETQNGELRKISLLKEEDRFYLKDGWKEFIDDHGIKEGYSLIFRNTGNSSFAVKFFDRTGCFREISNVAISTRNRVHDAAENLKRSQISKIDDLSSSREASDDYHVGHEISADSKSSIGTYFDEVIHCKRKLGERFEDHCVKPPKIDLKGFIQKSYLHGNSRPETKGRMENSEDITKILQHFYPNQLVNSSFVRLIMKSHLRAQPFMRIPFDFASEHFDKKPDSVLLKQNGKEWVVSCRCKSHRSSSYGFRGKSLQLLVQDNNLEEGDACIFRLVSTSAQVVMDVTVVRAAEICSIRKS
ncbi:B3 domain-containing transcription factor VRN1 [Platanthera zijinensis]|uniref:B3 domain-containing transcription factor VRN1 n=1 Tax=Platanthera zijinensis TaxID=2320716 RepID=A0AAP0G7F0_9ASPA